MSCTSCPSSQTLISESKSEQVDWSQIISREPTFFNDLCRIALLKPYSHSNPVSLDEEEEQGQISRISELKQAHHLMSWALPDMKQRWDRFVMKTKIVENDSRCLQRVLTEQWITFDGHETVFVWHHYAFRMEFFPTLLNTDQLSLLPFYQDLYGRQGLWSRHIYPCTCGCNEYEFSGSNLKCSVCVKRCFICHQILDWAHKCDFICSKCPWIDIHDPQQFAIVSLGQVCGIVQYHKIRHVCEQDKQVILTPLDPSNFRLNCRNNKCQFIEGHKFFDVETNTQLLLQLSSSDIGLFFRCLAMLSSARYAELYYYNPLFPNRDNMWPGFGALGDALLTFFYCERLKSFCVAVLALYLRSGSRRLLYEPKMACLVFDFLMYY